MQHGNLNPQNDMQAIREGIDTQILGSCLKDSMTPATGFPANVLEIDGQPIPGPPVLVEILRMDEIGHSALSLIYVAEARAEHTRQVERRLKAEAERKKEEDQEDHDRHKGQDRQPDAEEDIGVLPTYPRSMLHFELSDGSTTLQAFEFAHLPGFELGKPVIGRKVSV